jgi:hypothetical protein
MGDAALMLDHVFLDTIGTIRTALTEALLERQAFEERLQSDILLGDISWETSYGLPGEGLPPRVRADIGLEWPTWSQAAYRSWYIGDPVEEPPELLIEVALRVQRLREVPDLKTIMRALPDDNVEVGPGLLERAGPGIEVEYDHSLVPVAIAVEIAYEGGIALDDAVLEDPAQLTSAFGDLGGWIAATLVRLGDLQLDFLPADEVEE